MKIVVLCSRGIDIRCRVFTFSITDILSLKAELKIAQLTRNCPAKLQDARSRKISPARIYYSAVSKMYNYTAT